MVIRSQPFQVARLQLAYLSVSEYARQFWWYVATIPAFGLLLLIVGDNTMKVIGMMAMLWPLSLPARALYATRRSARLFLGRTEAEFREDGIYFRPESGKGLRLDRGSIHDMFVRKEWLVFRTRKFQFIPIPREAISDQDLPKIVEWVVDQGEDED